MSRHSMNDQLNNSAEMNIRSTGNKEEEILISFEIDRPSRQRDKQPVSHFNRIN